jgi:photosystem II stability/assembly factor-like uncharacterized protein
MRKLLLLIVFTIACLGQQLLAQLEVIGSEEYGRVFNINYDLNVENRLYALTLGNHIVVSNDNGLNWELLYSHPEPGTGLKALRILEDNTLSFYTNYGLEDALYILDPATLNILKKFTLPVPQDSEKEWIAAYSIYESNTNTALIYQGYSIGFGNYAKVYYTTNGGNSWKEVYYNVNYDEVFPNNVAISPDDPEKLFISRGNGPTDVDGGLFISLDAGTTWEEKFTGNTFDPIAFNPTNPHEILVGTSIGYDEQEQNLYRSTDGGITWNSIPIAWTNQTLDNITAIVFNPTDPNNIMVLDENEIVITYDNFATHEIIVYPEVDTHSYYYGLSASYNPFQGNEIFINADYHALFSTDGGETLTWSKNPYFATTGTVCLASGAEDHLYYGVQFGFVHRDLATGIDTPHDIKPLDYMSNSPGMTVFADPSMVGRVYSFTTSFMGSDLFVSNDHGTTTLPILNLFANNFHCVATDPVNPDIVWAAFSSFGENVELYKIDFSNPDAIISNLITLPDYDIVTGILIDETNPDNMLISLGTSVYESDNGGASWKSMSLGLEELVPYEDLILQLNRNPMNDDQFTIATNKGIFTSTDHTMHWSKIYDSIVFNLSHSSVSDQHIVAVIHNSNMSTFKIIVSNNGGSTWHEIAGQDLLYVAASTSAIGFNESMAEVYIGTYDLGLVKYSIDMNTVGFDEKPEKAGEIAVYPNPTAGELNISSEQEILSVEIFNLAGQKVCSTVNTRGLNISQLDDGAYFCRIHTADGNTTVVKIMK